jgi:Family of unknown function (DUF6152)
MEKPRRGARSTRLYSRPNGGCLRASCDETEAIRHLCCHCRVVGRERAALGTHSFGVVHEEKKPVSLTGVVSKIEWTSPHSFLFLDVKDADGKVTTSDFEGYPPTVLYRTGSKKDVTMKVGDEVTVFGWQARAGGRMSMHVR